MNGYVVDIEKATLENEFFRKVLFTAPNCQLVVMSLNVGEDIGEEVHQLDQFIRMEQGTGVTVLDGIETVIKKNNAIVIPQGAKHNIINTGDVKMKLYTVYAPPNHKDGIIHETKKDAEENGEHFDGVLR